MNCINQSIAQMINNTQGVNMVEICKFLNEDKLNELFHVIQTINEKNLELNLMISEDYNVAEKNNIPKSILSKEDIKLMKSVNLKWTVKPLSKEEKDHIGIIFKKVKEYRELNLMISEDYNVAEKKNKPKSKKVWNEKVWCEICEKHIFKATKSKHYKTNKHLDNLAIKNKQKMSKEELQNFRIRLRNKKIKTITTEELRNEMLDKKPLTKEELRRMREVLKRINERKK